MGRAGESGRGKEFLFCTNFGKKGRGKGRERRKKKELQRCLLDKGRLTFLGLLRWRRGGKKKGKKKKGTPAADSFRSGFDGKGRKTEASHHLSEVADSGEGGRGRGKGRKKRKRCIRNSRVSPSVGEKGKK